MRKDIAYGPTNMSLPQAKSAMRVRESMEAVGLALSLLTSLRSLSGGQKRRVAIAGVIAMRRMCSFSTRRPPASIRQAAMRSSSLSAITAQSGATISSSHSMEDISQIMTACSSWITQRVLFCDTPREVFSHADENRCGGSRYPMITKS